MTEYKVNAIAMKTDRAARRWNSFGQTAVKKNMVVKYIHDNSPIPIPAIFAPLDLSTSLQSIPSLCGRSGVESDYLPFLCIE